MAVLQMLSKMIRPVKLLGAVALPKLVMILQVSDALIPILICHVSSMACGAHRAGTRKLLATVATRVSLARARSRFVEGPVVAGQS